MKTTEGDEGSREAEPHVRPTDPREAEAIVLLRALLSGESSDTSTLVNLLLPTIHARVARALYRRRSLARGRDIRQELQDLIQEVLLGLFSHDLRVFRSWEPDRGLSLFGFVGLVSEHEVANVLRSRRRSPWTEDPTLADDLDAEEPDAPGPDVRAASREVLEQVLDGVRSTLTPKGLQLFQVLIIEEQEVADVSQNLKMSANSIYAWRSRLQRLIKKIAHKIMSESGPPRRSKERGEAQ